MVYKDQKTGREIEVFQEFVKGEDYTGVEVCGPSGEWEEELGCYFDEKGRLDDYDGAFGISMDVIRALRKAGWTVPRDFEDDAE